MNAFDQVEQAYKTMAAQAKYRPAAPSDGFGNITEPAETLDLHGEAENYAAAWRAEESTHVYRIGVPDYADRPALVYLIEAARSLCGMAPKADVRMLIQLALDERPG